MGRKRIGQYSGRLLSMRIPWSLEGNVEATVVEVWSGPPVHVRRMVFDDAPDEPAIILLPAGNLEAA